MRMPLPNWGSLGCWAEFFPPLAGANMAAAAPTAPPCHRQQNRNDGNHQPIWRQSRNLRFGAGVFYFIIFIFFWGCCTWVNIIFALTGPLQLGSAATGSVWTHDMAEFNPFTRCYAFEVETHIITKKWVFAEDSNFSICHNLFYNMTAKSGV